jgi:hypothetical protein
MTTNADFYRKDVAQSQRLAKPLIQKFLLMIQQLKDTDIMELKTLGKT